MGAAMRGLEIDPMLTRTRPPSRILPLPHPSSRGSSATRGDGRGTRKKRRSGDSGGDGVEGEERDEEEVM